jgi:YesN/AraC family two-component response regulator
MVCTRCIMIVQIGLEKLGIRYTVVELGRAETVDMISADQIECIKTALLQSGLALIDNKKSILVEKIKSVVIDMVNFLDPPPKVNFSDYLTAKLNHDYTYLANIFSENQGITIEHFIIHQKIERVKELIECNELNLTEISWKLHYSSVAHLSTQFKKVTGITPSSFKHLGRERLCA